MENHTQRIQRRLRLVRWVALVDLVLLVILVASSLTGNRELVRLFGPLHGGNFLLLLTIAGVGALDGLWRWWFPVAIMLTGGPLGALIGEWRIAQGLSRKAKIHSKQEIHS